jgi:hypothetical protein
MLRALLPRLRTQREAKLRKEKTQLPIPYTVLLMQPEARLRLERKQPQILCQVRVLIHSVSVIRVICC